MLYEFRSDNLESMEKVRDYFEETLEKFRKTGLDIRTEIIGERPCGRKGNEDPRQKELAELCRRIITKHYGKEPVFRTLFHRLQHSAVPWDSCCDHRPLPGRRRTHQRKR